MFLKLANFGTCAAMLWLRSDIQLCPRTDLLETPLSHPTS